MLIGGPPWPGVFAAGRSRRANDKDFHKDEKHFLYREYLRIIQVHKPTIFVMENVKGLLPRSTPATRCSRRSLRIFRCRPRGSNMRSDPSPRRRRQFAGNPPTTYPF